MTAIEIQQELEWILSEFEASMKLHRMKANTETIETIVSAPLEILEDLVKVRFSRIPKPIFALKKREIALLEAEMKSPGREISYIFNAREKFDTK